MRRAFMLQKLYTPAALDVMATMGRSAGAEPIAGISGVLSQLSNPEDRLNTATQTIEQARQTFGREPSTELGALALQHLGDEFAPIEESAEQAGDFVYEKTGSPLLATIAKIFPDIAGTAFGGATAKTIPKSVSKDFAAATPKENIFGDMLAVKAGDEVPSKVREGFQIEDGRSIRPKPGEVNVLGQRVRELTRKISKAVKSKDEPEEIKLRQQKQNTLVEIGKKHKGKVYFWEGDGFLDANKQDIGESIVDGVHIGLNRSGKIVDKNAPAKLFMEVGKGITEPGSIRLTGFKKGNKETSIIATNLRKRSHFEWTDIKGNVITEKAIKAGKHPELHDIFKEKIVSIDVVGDKHYYTIDLKQQGPTLLHKEGVDADVLQKGTRRSTGPTTGGAVGRAEDNPHLKTVQLGDMFFNKNDIVGYTITKTDKNKVAKPVYREIYTVGNQMPDLD